MTRLESTMTARVDGVAAWTDNHHRLRLEDVAGEEPLEIRVAGVSIAVTMRTPGDDIDLVTGFLVTEGIVASVEAIATIGHCQNEVGVDEENVLNANLHDPSALDLERLRRNIYASSSCGICGKTSIDSVRLRAPSIESSRSVKVERIYEMPGTLLANQTAFRSTGGIHAAGLFDMRGDLLAAREDVGRHNAVDKVIGWGMRSEPDRLPESILLVSGRASFEVVQKALMARIPIVAAVSAPSSLAIDLARSSDMTLIGFLRPSRCNVYAGRERIIS